MAQPHTAVLLKLLGCTILVAFLVPRWSLAPVLEVISLATWRAVVLIVGAVVGAAWFWWTRTWLGTVIAVFLGLLGGAVWLDFLTPRDVGPFHPTVVSVIEAVVFVLTEFGAVLGGASIGALAVSLVVKRFERSAQIAGDA